MTISILRDRQLKARNRGEELVRWRDRPLLSINTCSVKGEGMLMIWIKAVCITVSTVREFKKFSFDFPKKKEV
jgi:hypothetical protein